MNDARQASTDGATEGLTVLLGGARSGKSSLAVEIGRRAGRSVTVVVTATPFDDDLAARIVRHRLERPDWPTIEEPEDLLGALARCPDDHLVIVDCLTVWVGNLVVAGVEHAEVEQRAVELARALAVRPGPTVVISNEVGMGVHPPTALGRQYQDLLGRVNQTVVASADRAMLLVAGRAIVLTDPWKELR
jgi:adenosyl cobinamide kinase/adenosyl cobinamide phosphate guanylyltransferase